MKIKERKIIINKSNFKIKKIRILQSFEMK